MNNTSHFSLDRVRMDHFDVKFDTQRFLNLKNVSISPSLLLALYRIDAINENEYNTYLSRKQIKKNLPLEQLAKIHDMKLQFHLRIRDFLSKTYPEFVDNQNGRVKSHLSTTEH